MIPKAPDGFWVQQSKIPLHRLTPRRELPQPVYDDAVRLCENLALKALALAIA
jgi:hypothetical protein